MIWGENPLFLETSVLVLEPDRYIETLQAQLLDVQDFKGTHELFGDTIIFGNAHLNLNVSDFHRETLHCLFYPQPTGSMGPIGIFTYIWMDDFWVN